MKICINSPDSRRERGVCTVIGKFLLFKLRCRNDYKSEVPPVSLNPTLIDNHDRDQLACFR